MEAYLKLHELGSAHSVEVWQGDALVGGLYGVSIGRMFFGESMFSSASNASKVALIHLVGWLRAKGFGPLDCQIMNPHLESLGAELWSAKHTKRRARRLHADVTLMGPWHRSEITKSRVDSRPSAMLRARWKVRLAKAVLRALGWRASGHVAASILAGPSWWSKPRNPGNAKPWPGHFLSLFAP